MADNSVFYPDLEYMTIGEKEVFESLVNKEKFSFFRCHYCKSCSELIPKSKKFCSLECMEKFLEKQGEENENKEKKMKTSRWKWEVDLSGLIKCTVKIATKDGFRRHGLLTAVSTRTFEFDGKMLEQPYGIELNNDPGDIISFAKIEKLEIVN